MVLAVGARLEIVRFNWQSQGKCPMHLQRMVYIEVCIAAEAGFRWQSFSDTSLFALDGIEGMKVAI